MFIVDGLISQGVNVISGASKIGKSWLMLWLGPVSYTHLVSELKEIQKVSIQKEAEQQVQGLNRGQQRNKTLQKQVRDIVEAATSKNEEEYRCV